MVIPSASGDLNVVSLKFFGKIILHQKVEKHRCHLGLEHTRLVMSMPDQYYS